MSMPLSVPGQFIVEYVLLQHSLTSLIMLYGKAFFILGFHGLPDMSIHRECLQVVQRKETDTVRHFFTHTI